MEGFPMFGRPPVEAAATATLATNSTTPRGTILRACSSLSRVNGSGYAENIAPDWRSRRPGGRDRRFGGERRAVRRLSDASPDQDSHGHDAEGRPARHDSREQP